MPLSSLCARLATGAALLLIPAAWLAGMVPSGGEEISAARIEDVILARKTLMDAVEENANKIGDMISARNINLAEARNCGDTIAVLLMAFPHLFPPESNQWRESAEVDPVRGTLAAPEIWEDFAGFYKLAAAAVARADELRHATDDEEVKALHRSLGNICDSCHGLYMKE